MIVCVCVGGGGGGGGGSALYDHNLEGGGGGYTLYDNTLVAGGGAIMGRIHANRWLVHCSSYFISYI